MSEFLNGIRHTVNKSKKSILLFVIGLATVLPVCAYDFSNIGFGSGLGLGFDIGSTTVGNSLKINDTGTTFVWDFFADLTYAELGIGIGGLTFESKSEGTSTLSTDYTPTIRGSFLNLNGLLKYPFEIGGFSLAPAVGVEYHSFLTTETSNSSSKQIIFKNEEFNSARLFGALLTDLNFDRFFWRFALYLGYQFPTEYDKLFQNFLVDAGYEKPEFDRFFLKFRVALGWRLDDYTPRERSSSSGSRDKELENRVKELEESNRRLQTLYSELQKQNNIDDPVVRAKLLEQIREEERRQRELERQAAKPTVERDFVKGQGYEVQDDGTILVKGVTIDGQFLGGVSESSGYRGSPMFKLVIPARLEGKTVTKIDFGAFYKNNIASIEIPAGVKEIEGQAFINIPPETTITIRAANVKIEQGDFGSFDNGFTAEYNKQGRKAGVYTQNAKGVWSYRAR